MSTICLYWDKMGAVKFTEIMLPYATFSINVLFYKLFLSTFG